MLMGPDNFLHHLRQLVTGGGRDSAGNPKTDSGYLKRAEGVGLQSLAPSSAVTATAATLTEGAGAIGGTQDGDITALAVAWDGATDPTAAEGALLIDGIRECATMINSLVADVAALRAQLGLTADETNARVLKIEEGVDSAGNIVWQVPRDYDEKTDTLLVRVLASQLTVSTDNDVTLDMEAYVKTAGSALGSDLNPTAPGTILSTTEQWFTFDLGGNSLLRDDVVTAELITNGANDTDGEEVLIHSVEFLYRSTVVSYHEEDSSGNDLR